MPDFLEALVSACIVGILVRTDPLFSTERRKEKEARTGAVVQGVCTRPSRSAGPHPDARELRSVPPRFGDRQNTYSIKPKGGKRVYNVLAERHDEQVVSTRQSPLKEVRDGDEPQHASSAFGSTRVTSSHMLSYRSPHVQYVHQTQQTFRGIGTEIMELC
jgi:hypothetical protein